MKKGEGCEPTAAADDGQGDVLRRSGVGNTRPGRVEPAPAFRPKSNGVCISCSRLQGIAAEDGRRRIHAGPDGRAQDLGLPSTASSRSRGRGRDRRDGRRREGEADKANKKELCSKLAKRQKSEFKASVSTARWTRRCATSSPSSSRTPRRWASEAEKREISSPSSRRSS